VVAVFTVAVVLVIPAIIVAVVIPVVLASIVSTVPVVLVVTRNVFALVPVVLHKIDPLATGIVPVAVLVPMLRVARGYLEVHRRSANQYRLDDHRLPVDAMTTGCP